MLDWERRSLRLGPSDEPHFIRTLGLTFDPGADRTGTAWWVTAFFAPDIWRRWGVGLLFGSLNLWQVERPTELLPGVVVSLPEQIKRDLNPTHSGLARRWEQVRITPVLVQGEALGFVIRGDSPSQLVEVFAPTQLMTRLGIARNEKGPVQLGVLACDY